MGKEWEHTSWEQQHFIRMLVGISNVGYTDKVTDSDFYQTRCSRHFRKIIWIQGPMLRRSTGRWAYCTSWVWEYLPSTANAVLFWVWAPLSLHGQHASSDETIAPALAMNHFHHYHNRCHVFNQWAKCKPRKDSQIFVQFWSSVRFWNMTLTLFVVSVWAWPSQLAFVQRGAPLMTLHRKQAHTGCCLRIGTFSSTPPLAQGSLHNSFVYSMASRWALKCGQALEHERSKT